MAKKVGCVALQQYGCTFVERDRLWEGQQFVFRDGRRLSVGAEYVDIGNSVTLPKSSDYLTNAVDYACTLCT